MVMQFLPMPRFWRVSDVSIFAKKKQGWVYLRLTLVRFPWTRGTGWRADDRPRRSSAIRPAFHMMVGPDGGVDMPLLLGANTPRGSGGVKPPVRPWYYARRAKSLCPR